MKMKIAALVASLVLACMLSACDRTPKEWRQPNMTALTPRLQPMFEKTKTVCFGRFMIDVPASAIVSWGDAHVSLGVRIYRDGIDEINSQAQKFIEELKSEKAINRNDVPLLVSVEEVSQPQGKIVTGLESFEAIDEYKINGYFRLHNDGVVINSRPLGDQRAETVADIISIARRLRQQGETDIPTEPGNCVENGFLLDKQNPTEDDLLEHIRIGFRLKEVPDAHLSIYVAPANVHDTESDSLERQWKRIAADSLPEAKQVMATTKFLRKSPREIHDWKTGFEVLTRTPDEEGSLSHHDFQVKFVGVGRDVFRPYADIQFVTGVGNNAAGSAKASLTDAEAIAVWDKITSTIRVRPTNDASTKTAQGQPLLPLGELAATGRICLQTGWWQPADGGEKAAAHRQHFTVGERMPPLVLSSEPSLWQKLKREKPADRLTTTWELVAYDDQGLPYKSAQQKVALTSAPPDGTAAPKRGDIDGDAQPPAKKG